ncbi:MAG: acyltransferase [Bacteroidales bacterium]|jgi:phenylacetate-coenzyme A ligase PaaK-like adenylate-forming protein|nr:acyltransferase [Bacteroidales bacterium]NLM92161.1 acyl transferase [Bacteroidales bacterium]
MSHASLIERIFSLDKQGDFEALALDVFRHQYFHNEVYRDFCDALRIDPACVRTLGRIPFLPVSFFQNHRVVSFPDNEVHMFVSSGTTGSTPSRHFVFDTAIYEESFLRGFRSVYGEPSDYCILALLPGYLERSGSSLVYMADRLIELSENPHSGFYLHNINMLAEKLQWLYRKGHRVLLLGVTFALLELAEHHPMPIPNAIIMETGGMKGRRKELVRDDLHKILKEAFGVPAIHSEYGMTELFSQAYSSGKGLFKCPPWMRVLIRDPNDPLSLLPDGRTGGINIIDLANIYTCSFLATQDLGKILPGGEFEVLGRFDHSDIRGCNLMVE